MQRMTYMPLPHATEFKLVNIKHFVFYHMNLFCHTKLEGKGLMSPQDTKNSNKSDFFRNEYASFKGATILNTYISKWYLVILLL